MLHEASAVLLLSCTAGINVNKIPFLAGPTMLLLPEMKERLSYSMCWRCFSNWWFFFYDYYYTWSSSWFLIHMPVVFSVNHRHRFTSWNLSCKCSWKPDRFCAQHRLGFKIVLFLMHLCYFLTMQSISIITHPYHVELFFFTLNHLNKLNIKSFFGHLILSFVFYSNLLSTIFRIMNRFDWI